MKRAPRVDLNLYRIFDAIYTEGSLTRAGEVLHLTQPAVSNALSRLRLAYDDLLFVRTAGGMVPTPAAESIVAGIRSALQLLDESLNARLAFDPRAAKRRFRLSAGDQTAAMLVPRLLRSIAAYESEIELEILPLRRESVLHELASGQLDFAFDALPLSDPQLLSMKVLEEEMVCAVRAGHWATRQPFGLDDYLALAHVHASSRRQGPGLIDLALRRLGRQRRVVLRLPYHLGLPHVVAATDLAASIPKSLALAHGLQVLPLPFDTPPVDIHAFWHKSANLDGGSLWVRELLGTFGGSGVVIEASRTET
ncbi:MAG: LysR family transcriptional regulator [Gammaproteobacteria bacterium]|nr:LysR family transcriptional regulator [Gammaproteobacteria bacterium]